MFKEKFSNPRHVNIFIYILNMSETRIIIRTTLIYIYIYVYILHARETGEAYRGWFV